MRATEEKKKSNSLYYLINTLDRKDKELLYGAVKLLVQKNYISHEERTFEGLSTGKSVGLLKGETVFFLIGGVLDSLNTENSRHAVCCLLNLLGKSTNHDIHKQVVKYVYYMVSERELKDTLNLMAKVLLYDAKQYNKKDYTNVANIHDYIRVIEQVI